MRVYIREAAKRTLETRVPARLDRLPWERFHTLVAVALGITWILDGLEVTLAGSIAGALEASPRLHFTASDIGLASSFYLAGAVIGALGFGWMTDRLCSLSHWVFTSCLRPPRPSLGIWKAFVCSGC